MVSDYLAPTDPTARVGQDRWVAIIGEAGGGDDRVLAGLRNRCRPLRAGTHVEESACFGKLGKFLGEFGRNRALELGGVLTCRREFFGRGSAHNTGSYHVSDPPQRLCTVCPTSRENYRSDQPPRGKRRPNAGALQKLRRTWRASNDRDAHTAR
jgi:hypothetical protein